MNIIIIHGNPMVMDLVDFAEETECKWGYFVA